MSNFKKDLEGVIAGKNKTSDGIPDRFINYEVTLDEGQLNNGAEYLVPKIESIIEQYVQGNENLRFEKTATEFAWSEMDEGYPFDRDIHYKETDAYNLFFNNSSCLKIIVTSYKCSDLDMDYAISEGISVNLQLSDSKFIDLCEVIHNLIEEDKDQHVI